MDSHDRATPAVVEYAPADPNIVSPADAPLIDPDVSSDVFGIATHTNDTEAALDGGISSTAERKSWYKTPSVWWLLPITAVAALFRASTIAPRTELFIKFACDELRPEYRVDTLQWNGAAKNAKISSEIAIPITYVSQPVQEKRRFEATLLHPDKRCIQDKEVHRAAAKLSAAITSAQGMLSILTTGWWTQYSDRVGRTRILAISAVAVLITDALLFLVAFRADMIPGGYRILILGGAIDGLAGGFSAVVAASHAYVTDCSSPLARSRIFSFWTGVVYAGGALGPSLGALLNHYTKDLLSTFYVCTASHIVYGFLVFFVVPESLSVEARARAKEAYEADMNRHPQSVFGPLWRLTGFIRPLGVFIPKKTKGNLVGYILLGIVTSQNPFIGATIILSFGGGFIPAAQSLALALAHPSAHAVRRNASTGKSPAPAKQEVGRLFGALAVIQALGSQVAGPAIFSATFVASIGTHPRAIFWLSGVIIIIGLGALSAVRLDTEAPDISDAATEETPLLR
ncbi:hypothetical protein FRC06_002049 [Ceratobasidium sp. 370]|nr:hypothetical protein FRC06_002049 [Ceratobasidium sp. 370]